MRGAPEAEQRPQPAPPPPAEARPAAAPETKADLVRTPREICDDIWEQLNQSPFIDASRVTVSVDGSEVTLDGTINSLIAISLAQSLAANVAGVTRVQVRLRLTQPVHG